MVSEGFKRKLTAILSADAVGYSRLMRKDEEATVRDIASHRILIAEIIQQHNGRVIDSPGDNILAEFASVVDAVNSAIKIQKEIKKSNKDTPEDRRMEFRIGINLGDVIEEEERIYGDGVNIAARLEGLASAGGIAISGTVYEHIKEKLTLGYHYLGKQDVKNISEPVRVYRVLTDPGSEGKVVGDKRYSNAVIRKWAVGIIAALIIVSGGLLAWVFHLNQSRKIEPVSMEKLAFPLPEKPSLTVLPFKDLSGDQSQQYLANGATDAVRIALARVPNLFVIDHNSSSLYKDKDLKVKQVAEELGVRFVIEGSVQLSRETIRINAKLIDAIAGSYIWAETFDRQQEELLALQDEISQRIANELEVQLTEGEQARIWFRQTDNLEAYRQFRIGKEHYRKRNKRDNITARKLYEQAILLDPEFAEAECHLGFTYIQDALNGWTKNRKAAFDQASKLAQQAIKHDPNYPHAYALLGSVYLWQGERKKALELITRSIELEPNYAGNIAMQALTLVYLEVPGEALDAIESAMRLNPYYPPWYLGVLGRSYLLLDRYDEAIKAFENRKKRSKSLLNMVELAIANILAGRDEPAKEIANRILKKKPKFALKKLSMYFQYENPKTQKRFLTAAQKAGFPR
jgi:adenylate cyclase